MKKKSYVIPSMEVVALQMQSSLLAASGPEEMDTSGDFSSDVNSYGNTEWFE